MQTSVSIPSGIVQTLGHINRLARGYAGVATGNSVNAVLQNIVTSPWKKEVNPDICTTEKCVRRHGEEQTDHRATVMLDRWFSMVPSACSAPRRFYCMLCVMEGLSKWL